MHVVHHAAVWEAAEKETTIAMEVPDPKQTADSM
jgi:hypothetical protein